MASNVLSTLDRARPGMSRLRSTHGGMGYRAANIQAEQPKSSLLESIGRFAKAGADMYQANEEHKKSLADERSNEIIRKLTPEQRREALNNGTLLYQDDPYAMAALRMKTGRNAAYLVDDDVATKVKNGEFRTRQEMEEYRHSRLQEGAKSYAEQFGIDPEDEDFQKGFNADITERNISLYGAHDAFLNDQAQKGAVVNSKVELNSVLSDPQLLANGQGAEFFENYINSSLTTGSIPNDNQAYQVISSAISDASQRPGGANFLAGLADKKVTLNGTTSTYREVFGEEVWEGFMVKAQRAQYDNDAKMNEQFELSINSALNQDDPSVGLEMIQKLKAENDKAQPGEEMTPQRQLLINAQQQLQNAQKAKNAKEAKALDDLRKADNMNKVIEAQYQKRIDGEYVSTAYKDMPTNENTGKASPEAMTNFANGKLSQIDSMEIPEAAKDRLKMQYLAADSKDGPFRAAMGTMVEDASREWQSAVINGELPTETPAMDKLERLYAANPSLVASLYPENAEMFVKLNLMKREGIRPQMLIDGERQVRSRTKEMRMEDDAAWSKLTNDPKNTELARLPTQLDNMARTIYDAVKYSTGNDSFAKEQVSKFLKDQTASFRLDDDDSATTIGTVSKRVLQVNDDPASWEKGRDMILEARDKIIKANPSINNQQLFIRQVGDKIYLQQLNGESVIYDRALMSRMYEEEQRKEQEVAAQREKEVIDHINDRAPIVAATKARETAAKRIKEKRRRVPKYIYGRKDDE